MKKSILTFLMVFILLGGMSSSASDGMTTIIADLETQAASTDLTKTATQETRSTTSMPSSAVMLLIATGLVGLAGVSRRNNS